MLEIKSAFLFDVEIAIAAFQDIGATPRGHRRIAQIAGGTVVGPRLKGRVLPGGGDWIVLRSDGVLQLDVRLTLKTDDDTLIYMTYAGLRHGPKDVIDRLNRGETVDPASYYFRITPYFETGAQPYAWLNKICAVGIGDRRPNGPRYSVFEIL